MTCLDVTAAPATSDRRALVADIVRSSVVDGPGNRFVLFLQGCNFDCLACHNPHTIERVPTRSNTGGSRWMTLDQVLDEIRREEPFISGVTVSGGEATVQWRFVADLFGAIGRDPELAHLTRFVDTNGETPAEAWRVLTPVTDAAMIDLKAFDPDVHAFLTGRGNARVLDSIRTLASLGKLHEVRLLIIPGVNDRDDHLAATARFLTDVDPDVRIRVLGFRHHGTRAVADAFTEPDPAALRRVAAVLVDHGVRADRVSIWPDREFTTG